MDKIHVLIVEDEPTLARIIKDALEANHYPGLPSRRR